MKHLLFDSLIFFGLLLILPSCKKSSGGSYGNNGGYNPVSNPAPVAETNTTVFIGSDDSSLYAIDAGTGTLKWKFKAGGKVISSPSVGGGNVYFACLEDSAVYALDTATGNLK
jgi:outer membrane protein assembly factor BamB